MKKSFSNESALFLANFIKKINIKFEVTEKVMK